ncbi:MAG: APC family permease [Gammaproteobacteria bacterium]
MSKATFHRRTAVAVIVANMIGTGVFTSLGFQLQSLDSGFVILLLWLVGGLIALCGAMCYAELGAALPRSGGEYHFVGEIFHPALGFTSGWVSATVGFAAPTALAAVTFGSYVQAALPALHERALAVALIGALTGVHAISRQHSGAAQTWLTALKLMMIVGFCIATFVLVDGPPPTSLFPATGDLQQVATGAFAVSLIYVSYAYSGWNAATYLSSELDDPQRSLPGILASGTLIVTLLYLLLNAAFLVAAPADALRGQLEVGHIAARHVFGERTAALIALALGALLMSTVSAMLLAAPRVLHVVGEDYRFFSRLARTNKAGVPAVAIYLQGAIAIGFVLSGSFETILLFSGFIMALNTLVTVAGLIVLRIRRPDLPRPYRTWGYPVTPVLFLALTLWTLVFVFLDNPMRSLAALGLIAVGLVVYWLTGGRAVNGVQDASKNSINQ